LTGIDLGFAPEQACPPIFGANGLFGESGHKVTISDSGNGATVRPAR